MFGLGGIDLLRCCWWGRASTDTCYCQYIHRHAAVSMTFCCCTYNMHEITRSRSIQVELEKVEGYWSMQQTATANTGQVFEWWAASSLAADATKTIRCAMWIMWLYQTELGLSLCHLKFHDRTVFILNCNKSSFYCILRSNKYHFGEHKRHLNCTIVPNHPVNIFFVQCYKMDASPCGICLIINNVDFDPDCDLKDRKGSDIDCDKMVKRFKALNFEVICKKELEVQRKHSASSSSHCKQSSKIKVCLSLIHFKNE